MSECKERSVRVKNGKDHKEMLGPVGPAVRSVGFTPHHVNLRNILP